jgi:Holliday junction resolvasome RuvABC endonuclease subunit
MMSNNANPKRVLAIDPISRGFGFTVVESPTTLIDWGVKSVRQQKEESTLAKVSELIRLYRPEDVVLEDYKKSRRSPRIKRLLSTICDLAVRHGLKSRRFSTSHVKRVFQTFGAHTKHEIAQAVAQQLQ